MATIRLVPSDYTLSSTNYLSISDASNMYNNTDNDTYAQCTHNRSANSTYYLYISGFNFGAISSDWTINSFSVKIKALESGLSTSSTYRCSLYNNTTSISNTTLTSSLSTSVQTLTFPTSSLAWNTLKNYGSNFRIRVPLRRATSGTSGYVRVYGAEIEVNYTIPNPRTVTTTLTGSGTIDPSGTQTMYDGDTYNLIVVPTNENDTVTATKNGSAITLTAHTTAESIEATADSLTTGFSGGSNMQFYTSSSSTGHNFNYAIGHTATSPGSTSSGTGSWTYVKDNGSSTNYTGYADFVFDFSSIPEGSTINSVTVQCYGATESTTESTAHSEIILYSGTTQKSTSQKFTSTSNAIITISSPGTWTRAELQSAKLRFVVGYYGGHIFGITWTVSYTPPKYYSYTTTISGDMTIAVTIGGGTSSKIYVKVNGSWVAMSKGYKKVNGSWVETDITELFDSNKNYKKG